MKQKMRILAAVLSMLSLTACGTAGSSLLTSGTENTGTTVLSDTETTAPATAQSSGTSAELTTEPTTDPALTTSSEREVSTTATAVQATRDDWLDSIGTLLDGGYTAKLRCTGTVSASDGLHLRKAPGTSAESLKKLKDGTKLEITGLAASGAFTEFGNRWLRVKAGGQEGYVCSEYVNAECSIPLAQLSGEEIGALGILMYYQGVRLYLTFEREGGISAKELTDEYDGEFCRVKPDGLTLAKLRTDLHRWFTADFPDDFDTVYREKDGALWVMTGYGDNVALEYTIPEKLTARTDSTLTYEIRAQWYPDFDMNDAKTEYPFVLRFEDGAWKIAEIKQLY